MTLTLRMHIAFLLKPPLHFLHYYLLFPMYKRKWKISFATFQIAFICFFIKALVSLPSMIMCFLYLQKRHHKGKWVLQNYFKNNGRNNRGEC